MILDKGEFFSIAAILKLYRVILKKYHVLNLIQLEDKICLRQLDKHKNTSS